MGTPADAHAEAVARAYAVARAAYPEVPFAADAFAAVVANHAATAAAVDELRAEDLYLAHACASGEPTALAAFDREMIPVIERAVTAAGATVAETADLVQIVRVRLLVAKPEAPPAIATFAGRSRLATWIKVVATREAARLLAHDRREELAEDDTLSARIGSSDDPLLEHLKRTYREEFRAAFAAAVDALTDRERLLLRQNVIDGIGIDDLAVLYAIHRATAARWVAAARRAVIAGTHAALRARLRLAPEDLDSILQLIQSQLDISLPQALREAGAR